MQILHVLFVISHGRIKTRDGTSRIADDIEIAYAIKNATRSESSMIFMLNFKLYITQRDEKKTYSTAEDERKIKNATRAESNMLSCVF